MEPRVGIEGKWEVDAPPALTFALAQRLEIADRLAGERWKLKRNDEHGITGRLRGGPVHITLEREDHNEESIALQYKLAAKRYGITVTAKAEIECQSAQNNGSIIAIRFRLDGAGLLRFVPRAALDQRILSMQQELLITLDQALEALYSDKNTALARLNESDKELVLGCLQGSDLSRLHTTGVFS